MCGGATPRRVIDHKEMGCALGSGYALMFGPKAEREAQPQYLRIASGEAKPRLISDGIAGRKAELRSRERLLCTPLSGRSIVMFQGGSNI